VSLALGGGLFGAALPALAAYWGLGLFWDWWGRCEDLFGGEVLILRIR
jgi:hypothetical protein